MNILYKFFLFASLCFFTSCYKQKACFTSNLYSGDIIQVLGNCKKDGNGDFVDIDGIESFVYLSEISYNKALQQGSICKFNNIDFSKFSLLGYETEYPDTAYFDRNVKIDTVNKIIYFNVKTTYNLRRFKLRNRSYTETNLVVIPKVTKNYKIITTQTLMKCD